MLMPIYDGRKFVQLRVPTRTLNGQQQPSTKLTMPVFGDVFALNVPCLTVITVVVD